MKNNNPLQHLAHVITDKFIQAAPQAAAHTLNPMSIHEILLLVGGQKAQRMIAVFNRMDPAKAAAVLRRLALKQAAYVLTHLEVPQAANLWKELPAPYQARMQEEVPASFVQLMQAAVGFTAVSVGSAMQTDFVAVTTEAKVGELVARLKNLPRTKIPLVCFITGKNGEFKGIIRTVELVFFNPAAVCGSVMNKNVRPLKPGDEVPAVQEFFSQCQSPLLPVVSDTNLLLGVLSKGAGAAPAQTAVPRKWWQRLKFW